MIHSLAVKMPNVVKITWLAPVSVWKDTLEILTKVVAESAKMTMIVIATWRVSNTSVETHVLEFAE